MKLSLFKRSPYTAWSLLAALLLILAYVVAFGVSLIENKLAPGTQMILGLLIFIGFVFVVLPLSLLGTILAIVSLFRREERPVLAVFSLIVNMSSSVLIVLLRALR